MSSLHVIYRPKDIHLPPATPSTAEWSATLATVGTVASQRVDIRTHGAIAGDDTVDNIGAINAAIVAAGDGGEVFVPAGTWYVKPSVTHFIEMVSRRTLRLAPGAVLKVRDDTGGFPTLITDATGGNGATYVEDVAIVGGTVDLSPETNLGYTMDPNDLNVRQQAIKFGHFRNITVEGVTFHSCGRNTVVLSGAECYNATVVNNRIFWVIGPLDTALEYDNSAVYITVRWGATVRGNTGFANPAHHPRGFVELHGQGLTFSDNHSDGFGYLCYITPNSVTAQEYGVNGITVTNNTARRAWKGISLFSFPGRVLTGVTVSGNVIGVAQKEHNWNSAYGIAFEENASTTGDYEDVTITGNVVIFEAGDTRTVSWTGSAVNHALTYGIGVSPYGNVRNVTIADNIVRNAPSYGIKVGRYGSEATVANVSLMNNTVIDAGGNSTAANSERAALALFGTLTDVTVDRTRVVDTGATRIGYYHVHAQGVGLIGTTRSTIRRTEILSASGTMPDGVDRAKVGTGGERVNVDFPSIPANTTVSQNVTVTGASTLDTVTASPGGGLESGLAVAWVAVTSANTVTIALRNTTGSAIDPSTRPWNITVTPIL